MSNSLTNPVATLLYRVGQWSFRHRLIALLGWLGVLVAVALLASAVKRPTNDQFSIPGTESQQALDLLTKKFPAASGSAAQIVFAAPAGESLAKPEYVAAINATVARAAKASEVIGAGSPFTLKTISPDARIAFARVAYPYAASQISKRAQNQLYASADPARAAGLEVAFGGGIVTTPPPHSYSEAIGLGIAFVILSIAISSLLGALFPLITALIGVGIGLSAITAVGALVNLSSTAPILASMIGLAVGMDYALFIITRYRQLLNDGLEPIEAVGQATARAGSAVVFAGLTVIIALCGLAALDIPFLTVMGLAAAGTVAIAVMIALTLMPALLAFGGRRIQHGALARFEYSGDRPVGLRWAKFVTGRPLTVLIVGIAALIFLAVPAIKLQLGLPDAGSSPPNTTERKAYDLLTEGFGPGFNGPLTIVVKAPSNAQASELAATAAIALTKIPDVMTVTPPQQNATKDLTVIGVIPKSTPTSEQTSSLVAYIRDRAQIIKAKTGVDVLVTGQTAVNIDVANKLNAALPAYAAIVILLALVLLTLAFRSLIVPIKAALGFLLSVSAALGVVVFVFQDGHFGNLVALSRPGPIISFLPVLLIGILFGLAMDYEVFLVSRMREQFTKTGDATQSVISGVAESGRVVTAAALIMFSVFASFIFGDNAIIKSIGLVLAIGVLADAFIVRMTLVPAVMKLLGSRAWWLPGWLERHLPNVDIEGASLKTSEPKRAPGDLA